MQIRPEAVASLLFLIPLLPFAGAVINGLFGRWLGRANVGWIASGVVFASFLISVGVFVSLLQGEEVLLHQVYPWFAAGDFSVEVAFLADRLTAVMLLVVTGVGFLIHVYSVGYMAHDPAYSRFFAYLNLFVGMMLVLVLGDSLPVIFVGWEGVGLSSYLLIGFWYSDTEKAIAGKKAFIVNRVGDFGFLLGMFVLFALFGTLSIPEMRSMSGGIDPASAITGAGLFSGWTWNGALILAFGLVFLGATGKSAQIPLFVWLPDAMAGPTPVSALIHAATMVTAGVYVLARLSFMLVGAPEVMAVIAFVGALTALLGAFMGLFQTGIKKVLAYSTISQLGYMFIGVGVGAFYTGVYHLFTHAFFKALLFLAAGAVMHAVANQEDIRKMGGLRKKIPHTHFTFLIATITITGVLPLSGFFSKDAILHQALLRDLGMGAAFPWILWGMGSLAALFTSIYMWRLYVLTFRGEPREAHLYEHAHESPPSMTIPLWILAVMSVLAAVWGVPHALNVWHLPTFETWLEPVLAGTAIPSVFEAPEILFLLIALAIAWAGFGIAFAIWGKRGVAGDDLFRFKAPWLYKPSYNKLWWDEFYDAVIVRPLVAFSGGLWWFVDVLIIDHLFVEGSAKTVRLFGRLARPFQNGDAQRYAAVVAIGAAVVLALLVGWRAVAAEQGSGAQAQARVVEVR